MKIKDHKSTLITDPLRNFKFVVQINHPSVPGIAELGFMNVSGLSVATEVIPYREGGNNTSARKMPGQTNYSDITLTNGVVIGGRSIWKWFSQIFFVNQGTAGMGSGPATDFRANRIGIFVMGHPINDRVDQPARALFEVYNAWPSSLAFSDLDAGGNAVLVQQMVLAHEGWNFHLASALTDDAGNVQEQFGGA